MEFLGYKMNTDLLSSTDYVRAILRSNIYDLVQITPLQKMEKVSERLNNKVFIKREDRQIVHSFKLRGAHSMISSLSETEKQAGVIAASAGNHAQGVAFSAKYQNVKAIIVMPENTPAIKIEAVKGFGGEVLLHGANFDEAKAKAIQLSKDLGMTFIPPFDHHKVIAGQGTIGLELLQQNADIDRIFVPVGGGGIAAGIAVFIKKMLPEVKVIGVESTDSACLYHALKEDKPTDLENIGLFADGVAVRRIGDETFRLCKKYLDDVVLVSSDEVCTAMKDIFENVRAVAEPSGAVALAGLKKYVVEHNIQNETLTCILSGANLNFHTLRYVSERCELGEKQEVLLAVTIPEQKGSFLKFCNVLGNYVVTEFNYRHADDKNACIFVGIRVKNELETTAIIHHLKSNGYDVVNLSEDDTAKTHIRYMIGGHTHSLKSETLYSFEFPEQKGALLRFLQTLGAYWDISLFHYRTHGVDYGDVLVAFMLDENDKVLFHSHLDVLGYRYKNVSDSAAYQCFLK